MCMQERRGCYPTLEKDCEGTEERQRGDRTDIRRQEDKKKGDTLSAAHFIEISVSA